MNQLDFIGSVPAEIWAEIFEHAHKPILVEAPYDQAKPRRCDIPISVAQLCGRLRQIAISTPRLWTRIAIDFSSPNPSSNLSMTKLWLERSGNSPLSIFIYQMKGLDMVNNNVKRECFTAVLSHIGRWREASIEWANTDSDFWSLFGNINPAPLLESLFLEPHIDEDQIRTRFLPSTLWAHSPRLRKLVVVLHVVIKDEDDLYRPADVFSSWTISNLIPYHQITHLHLDAHTWEIVSCSEIISIFQHASNLVCCFIEGISDYDSSIDLDEYSTPILLSQLRHLYLELDDDGVTVDNLSASQLLNLITAPSLLSLTLVDYNILETGVFESFIRRSSCALEELNLFNIDLDLRSTHACMELTSPSLRRLHVNDLEITDEYRDTLLTSMSEWDAAANAFALCPNLEQVSMRSFFHPKARCPPGLLFITEVLESRLRPASRGLTVTFKTLLLPSQRFGKIPPTLSALREHPLGLTIGDNDHMNDDVKRRIPFWKRLAYDY